MNKGFAGLLSLFFVSGVFSAVPAKAAAKYNVLDLGMFAGTRLNSAGEGAGLGPSTFYGVNHAYLWNGTLIDLGSLNAGTTVNFGFRSDAVGIDSQGRVYGTSEYLHLPSGMVRAAFIWDGIMHAVPHPAGAVSCQATSANDSGEVVGLCYLGPPSKWRSFIFSRGASRLFAPLDWEIDDVNNSGEILISDASGRANLYSHGKFQALEKSFATLRLNDAGIAAGALENNKGRDAAYFDGSNYVDLGTLPGFPYAGLSALNGNGAGVGSANDGNGSSEALYYDRTTGIIDLNNLIDPRQGFHLDQGVDINAKGQILALGGSPASTHTYLLTPKGP